MIHTRGARCKSHDGWFDASDTARQYKRALRGILVFVGSYANQCPSGLPRCPCSFPLATTTSAPTSTLSNRGLDVSDMMRQLSVAQRVERSAVRCCLKPERCRTGAFDTCVGMFLAGASFMLGMMLLVICARRAARALHLLIARSSWIQGISEESLPLSTCFFLQERSVSVV